AGVPRIDGVARGAGRVAGRGSRDAQGAGHANHGVLRARGDADPRRRRLHPRAQGRTNLPRSARQRDWRRVRGGDARSGRAPNAALKRGYWRLLYQAFASAPKSRNSAQIRRPRSTNENRYVAGYAEIERIERMLMNDRPKFTRAHAVSTAAPIRAH